MLHVDRTRLLSGSSVPDESTLRLPAPDETALAVWNPVINSQLPARQSPRVSGPAWLTPLLTTLVVVLGSTVLVQHFSSTAEAKAALPEHVAAPSADAAYRKPSPVQAKVEDEPPYPFAQFVEVTGVRVVMDANHRSQVQYQVLNTSDTPLTNIGLTIGVRPATGAAGLGPLFTVSARVPLLGPHQSKEIRTDLDSDLRADVQVTSQQ